MTAAYRMRGLGWFLAVVIVALGFYLVSLQVAAERKRLDDVIGAIGQAHRQIRGLETEFNTRANLAQLERWNGSVLALAAPNAEQFLPDEARLAMIDFRPGAQQMPGDQPVAGTPQMAVRNANYLVPALPVDADRPATAGSPVAAPAPLPATTIRTTGAIAIATSAPLHIDPVAPRQHPATIAASATVPLATVRRDRSVAMLDHKRVNDSTLSDLLSRAEISTERAR